MKRKSITRRKVRRMKRVAKFTGSHKVAYRRGLIHGYYLGKKKKR
jgi:hypothetical protein